ncbi:MAG: methyltransferase domain-containing protein [Lysobacteraceae bacterium]|jgi:SAM-dependent methyltransferase
MPALRAFRQPEADPDWFGSSLALRVMRAEQAATADLLAAQAGVRGVFLTAGAQVPTPAREGPLRAMIALHRAGDGYDGDLRCAAASLPFVSGSLCLVHLFHVLERQSSPEAFLAECARTLREGGMLMVVALDPYSLWRLHWRRAMPGVCPAWRLRQALEAAGLVIEHEEAVGPPWLWRNERARGRGALPAALPAALRPSRVWLARRRATPGTPLPLRSRRLAPGVSLHVR